MEEESYSKQFLCLVPFFILHLSSGMCGSFTTVLVEQYEKMNALSSSVNETHQNIMEFMIGTFQDIPPIIFAVLGGFLQQVFGPRKLLIVSAVPIILSWVVVALSPSSTSCLLLSRIFAGLSNGLLSGNVYMPSIASSQFIGSFKMVELASKNIGSILMFLGTMICLHSFSLSTMCSVSAVFPFVGLVGMCFARESPLFNFRHELSTTISKEENKNPVKTWFRENLQKLKFPIGSPTVYKPLLIITFLICLGQCSGSAYIYIYIIQIISEERGITNAGNSTILEQDEATIDNAKYLLPILTECVRLLIIFFMSFLLQKLRVRFLYFFSLISTVLTLCFLGLFSNNSFFSELVSSKETQYIKTFLLCCHIIFIQFGLANLPLLLIDILFPTSCKPVLKGLTRAICSVFIISFVFVFKQFSYSNAFFLMATLLVLSLPVLYLFIPEIRNIGTNMSEEFFLPTITVFYFVLPENKKGSQEARENAIRNWKSAVRKISTINKVLDSAGLQRQIDVDICARKFTKVKFDDTIPDFDEALNNVKYANLNCERVSFVSNILGQGGFLCENPCKDRVLIGRGPILYNNEMMRKGSIFLFSDVIIIAKCIVANRRYVGEVCFKLDDPTFTVQKNGKFVRFSENLEIEFEDDSLATIWEKYINFWKKETCD